MLCAGFLLMWCFVEAPQTPTLDTLSFCDAYRVVKMSHADTRGTKERVAENNRIWREKCSAK